MSAHPVNIVFGIPGYGPLWAPAVESWLRCIAYTSRELSVTFAGKLGGTGVTDRMYTSSAENRLVDGFLAIPEATHLFLTEQDMILEKDAILQLLEADKPIISGVYFLRASHPLALGQPCLYRQVAMVSHRKTKGDPPYAQTPVSLFPQQEPFRLGDVKTAGCPGLGCVLMQRQVFHTIPAPWFRVLENQAGSDLYFYKQAQLAGLDVWVDPRVRCGQVDYYCTTIEDYQARLEYDEGFRSSGYIIGAEGLR